MRRRAFLTGAAAALARPAIAASSSTLVFVPQAALSSIDPVWTSAMTVRNFGMMVFETLYGRDAAMNPKPQMLAGEVIEDDGKRRTMTLRDGLRFHDGEPVLARDCVASLRRWMKRDPVGATIEARVGALEAPDDRTIVWRLSKPFAHLAKALSKFQTAAVMMPARLAATDPFKQIPEAIGSGPFRFLASEQVIGSFAAFAKFDRYVPRDEPASFTAGGHHVLLDRVEWQMIPDASTAANALITGEVDWIEQPVPDLLPMMRRAGVVTERLDDWGFISQLRPNHTIAPTNNVGVRRASNEAAGRDGSDDGRRSGWLHGACRIPGNRQAGSGPGGHRECQQAAQHRSGEADAGQCRLQRRTAGAAAHHRSTVSCSVIDGCRRRADAGRHAYR